MVDVYTRGCVYYKHVVVLTNLNTIVYDWLIYTSIRTVPSIRVDQCEIHAVHECWVFKRVSLLVKVFYICQFVIQSLACYDPPTPHPPTHTHSCRYMYRISFSFEDMLL
jgi:hypothetical protein